jgi:hypothetical protein
MITIPANAKLPNKISVMFIRRRKKERFYNCGQQTSSCKTSERNRYIAVFNTSIKEQPVNRKHSANRSDLCKII